MIAEAFRSRSPGLMTPRLKEKRHETASRASMGWIVRTGRRRSADRNSAFRGGHLQPRRHLPPGLFQIRGRAGAGRRGPVWRYEGGVGRSGSRGSGGLDPHRGGFQSGPRYPVEGGQRVKDHEPGRPGRQLFGADHRHSRGAVSRARKCGEIRGIGHLQRPRRNGGRAPADD